MLHKQAKKKKKKKKKKRRRPVLFLGLVSVKLVYSRAVSEEVLPGGDQDPRRWRV